MRPILGGTLVGRMVRVFLLQAAAISLAVVVGVFAAAQVVEQVLVSQALDSEAAHYWSLYDENPAFPRPNTANLRGYLRGPDINDPLPAWLVVLDPGFQTIDRPDGDRPLVHISEHDDHRLYLVFEEVQVTRLAFFFGVAPLSMVLLVVYALVFVGYRLSRTAISPVVQLAERVSAFDVRHDDLAELDLTVEAPRGSESMVLSEALQQFTRRIGDFVRRERNFTRNASHELRTPLAVMRANLDALGRRLDGQPGLEVPVERMKRTVRDMEKLMETLLVLAREDESGLPRDAVILNDLLAERLATVSRAVDKPGVSPRLQADCLLQIHAPQKVLTMVFDNLVRNALLYTEAGEVVVEIREDQVCVRDTGPGIPEDIREHLFEPFRRGAEGESGYGLGLTIVKRLCDRFGWSLDVQSEVGTGTSICVDLPDAEVVGRRREEGE